MKTVGKFVTLILLMFVFSLYGFSQTKTSVQKPETTTQNLVRGVIGPVGNSASWQNYTVVNLVPGSGLFPITSSTTVFYYGFTAGTEADISNMVVYTTPHGSLTISAVTPVTLGGISHPSIVFSSACPVTPSSATPCIVRFDPTTLTMSPTSDYYFAVYFTSNDNNNATLGGAAANPPQTSLAGTYFGGNYTTLTVGESVPGRTYGGPIFLMYVMNN
jgi:hypothetical protein